MGWYMIIGITNGYMTLECYSKNVSISTVYSKVAPVELDFQLIISFLTASELETGHKLKSCHIGPIKGVSNFSDPYSYAGIILCQTGPPPCWRDQNPVQIFSLKVNGQRLKIYYFMSSMTAFNHLLRD